MEIEKNSGLRETVTGQKLWTAIKDSATGRVMTDYWRSYTECIPPAQHLPSKAETFTVEGYNRSFRHVLARLERKSKCYSRPLRKLDF